MYIKSSMTILSTVFHQTENLEMICCKVQSEEQMLLVLGLYKPPITSYICLLEELSECLSFVPMSEPIILIGDFNIDIHGRDQHRFIQHMLSNYNLQQCIAGPSTWDDTCIDLVFSNIPSIQTFTLVNTWSKHNTVFGIVPKHESV